LPEEGRISIPIENIEVCGGRARAEVIKDGGDDPDVTHGARIVCSVSFADEKAGNGVIIRGGKGVGVVTRPGLPVAVGEPAINPSPRKQIVKAVGEALAEARVKGKVIVTIEVPDGEEIAKKTFNPRLGIVGGISILGTRGTVIPFSHEAYRQTIALGMDVARASGLETIAISTGGKSEKFLRTTCGRLPEQAFVQAGDFFSFSLSEAGKRGFSTIFYSCFFGKLVKMAQGHRWTHASKSNIDFGVLARWCVQNGIDHKRGVAIKNANTAREALEIIRADERGENIIEYVAGKAIFWARRFAGPLPDLRYYLFDPNGTLILTVSSQGTKEGTKDL